MRNRWLAAPVLAAAVIGLAACGSSSPSSSSTTPAAPAAAGGSASSSQVKTGSTSVGTVVVNAQGHTLYWFAIDTPTASNCTGTCVTFWPPVKGPVTAAAGVSLSGKFGTIKRADGTLQATYMGHPLYTFAADSAAEGARLDAAIAQSRKQLLKLQARLAVLPEESQTELAPLIDAYIRMLGPSRLIRGVRRRVEETLLSAESAVLAESDAIAATIQAQAEPGMPADDRASLQRRADEVREIGRRLVRNLTRSPFRSFAGLPEGAVLISEALRPADAALLNPARLAGVATEEGGADGHTAVMLRALGVPAVLGAAGLAHAIKPGDLAVVDGLAGTVVLNPTGATLAAARRAVAALARERQRFAKLRLPRPWTARPSSCRPISNCRSSCH